MELIMDILMELLFEGAVEASAHPRVPKLIRIILIVLLAAFYGGLVILCFSIAVIHRSFPAAAMGAVILVITVLAAKKVYLKRQP